MAPAILAHEGARGGIVRTIALGAVRGVRRHRVGIVPTHRTERGGRDRPRRPNGSANDTARYLARPEIVAVVAIIVAIDIAAVVAGLSLRGGPGLSCSG